MTAHDRSLTAIAVDLGATNMRAGLVRQDGEILSLVTAPTPTNPENADVIVRALGSLILRAASSTAISSAAGIGISTAGPVDQKKGAVINPPNIPLPFIPVATPLGERFGLPVRFMNDCHAGARGEAAFGGGRGVSNFVYLTISTGIGAGVYEQGRLLSGEEGNFAEVGHFIVETTWNLPCGCGGKGHWEGCGSGRFIPAFFSEWCRSMNRRSPFRNPPDAATIFEAAAGGDPVAGEFISVLGKVEARGISLLIAAYDPRVIIIDGSVARKNWQTFEACVLPHVRSVSGKVPHMCMSSLNGNAPLLGAAWSVFAEDTSP
ncbi:MAG: N-acetylmannosamine kinase [Methanoregulaceae archaeon PtaU1.Bin059]|nr:MAG: N-acetylmannosamine kinase [Methanoregulaceae archaeon PtaB.Bin056]OPY43242.1 MAG: N-acetylmannosamine kinase [Methanoregulaceae archaeon PtaU1.Bin059]